MPKSDEELHHESMQHFIELANKMANEGMPRRVVSAGLMTASCVYATYLEVGNADSLDEAGIDRIADGYKKHLVFTQESRQKKAQQSPDEKIDETVDRIVSFPEDD